MEIRPTISHICVSIVYHERNARMRGSMHNRTFPVCMFFSAKPPLLSERRMPSIHAFNQSNMRNQKKGGSKEHTCAYQHSQTEWWQWFPSQHAQCTSVHSQYCAPAAPPTYKHAYTIMNACSELVTSNGTARKLTLTMVG
jgi:hypothetical protein